MFGGQKRHGFAVWFDPKKTTSGQRFYSALCQALSSEAVSPSDQPRAILFNVSAPVGAIFKAKMSGLKIALRVDGLYFDRLCPAFISTFGWPLNAIFSLGLGYPWLHDAMAFWANFLNQNYAAFIRICLADLVVYQSQFSKKIHARYFPRKPCHVILNGAALQEGAEPRRWAGKQREIQLITVYDGWKPAKRIDALVDFVFWLNQVKGTPARLTVLGYSGKVPVCGRPQLRTRLEGSPFIRTLPRFSELRGEFSQALFEADLFITFSYRDPCPNVVIESMAFGLPLVAVGSGGVPEICGDAGILIPCEDFKDGWYTSHRFECDFPRIDYDRAFDAVVAVAENPVVYRERVLKRFRTDLGLDVVAAKYAVVLQDLANRGASTQSDR